MTTSRPTVASLATAVEGLAAAYNDLAKKVAATEAGADNGASAPEGRPYRLGWWVDRHGRTRGDALAVLRGREEGDDSEPLLDVYVFVSPLRLEKGVPAAASASPGRGRFTEVYPGK